MIELSTLAKELQDSLNNLGLGYTFKIFSDTGKFQKSIREDNAVTEYINGELRSLSSDLTTLDDGSILATQNCKLDLIFMLEDEEENEQEEFFEISQENGEISTKQGETIIGNITKVNTIHKALNNYFQSNSVSQNSVSDGNGKVFIVTKIYQLAESGQRSQVEILGNSFTFSVYIYYMFVQNGINTKNQTFELDGLTIPLQSITIYRTPVMDGNVYADTKNGSAKNIASMSQFSVSIELPALTKEFTDTVLESLYDGELNVPHILRVNSNYYLVSFGENRLIGETIKNMGQSITFVECPDEYDLLNFPTYNNKTYRLYLYNFSGIKYLCTSLNGSSAIGFNFDTKEFGEEPSGSSTRLN